MTTLSEKTCRSGKPSCSLRSFLRPAGACWFSGIQNPRVALRSTRGYVPLPPSGARASPSKVRVPHSWAATAGGPRAPGTTHEWRDAPFTIPSRTIPPSPEAARQTWPRLNEPNRLLNNVASPLVGDENAGITPPTSGGATLGRSETSSSTACYGCGPVKPRSNQE